MVSTRVTPYDKVHALKRSGKYAEDYKKYIEERGEERERVLSGRATKLSNAAKRLCVKWNIGFPIAPETPFKEEEEFFVESPVKYLESPKRWKHIQWMDTWNDLSKDELPDEIIDSIGRAIDWTEVLRPRVLFTPGLSQETLSEIPEEVPITHVNYKLVLMINTDDFSENQIMTAIAQFIKGWVHKTKTRQPKETSCNIWKVYDLQKERKNLMQVAREIFGFSEGLYPTYDEEVAKWRKQVERAYEKARRIIKTIEQYADSRRIRL